MKSLSAIQKLSKIGKVLCKIAFIFSVIGFCGCIAGLLSMNLCNGSLIKIGGVTLHGLISSDYGYNIKSITAALSVRMVSSRSVMVSGSFLNVRINNAIFLSCRVRKVHSACNRSNTAAAFRI